MARSIDPHYTPVEVGRGMVSVVARESPGIIADFSAGDGDLLKVAAERWVNASVIATDVSRRVTDNLKREHPFWTVGKCDFLCERSRRRCKALRSLKSAVDVILLNPPFSCRGNKRYKTIINGLNVSCSLSLCFVVNALEFLHPSGEMIAILPAGAFTSEKDRAVWKQLKEEYLVTIHTRHGRGVFYDCYPRTAVVTLKRRRTTIKFSKRNLIRQSAKGVCVAITRGVIPMHAIQTEKPTYPLIHSTDLKGGVLCVNGKFANARRRLVSGPAVLIPRVGEPSIRKVTKYFSNRRIVLSDCVFAIRCPTGSAASKLYQLVRTNWRAFHREYGGTCARYLTLAALQETLYKLGYDVTISN